jgi:hypothetical protein
MTAEYMSWSKMCIRQADSQNFRISSCFPGTACAKKDIQSSFFSLSLSIAKSSGTVGGNAGAGADFFSYDYSDVHSGPWRYPWEYEQAPFSQTGVATAETVQFYSLV